MMIRKLFGVAFLAGAFVLGLSQFADTNSAADLEAANLIGGDAVAQCGGAVMAPCGPECELRVKQWSADSGSGSWQKPKTRSCGEARDCQRAKGLMVPCNGKPIDPIDP